MCLAIPGKLISIDDSVDAVFRSGKVSFGGIIKNVNLCMIPEAQLNDYILVHVGVGIGIVNEEEAIKTFEYLKKTEDISEELNLGND